ncbi:MAG: Uma2 family endonuclease [Thermoguttaceae bacterium]|jgi:hypothetical protein|nr:Uma2 family endonuclease [Thermoguttaceae bacterium]
MATDTAADTPMLTIPPELYPNVDHLVTEDDTPVDNVFAEKQQRLLTEALHSSWGGPGPGRPFVAMSNVGLFYNVCQPPYVPDTLVSLDVALPANIRLKAHRSYFVWLYGKPPDLVIEVVSNRDGGEATEKLAGYARLGIRYYTIFDPDGLLGNEPVRAYRLVGMNFQRLDEPVRFPDVGLGLCVWHGWYEDMEANWLRWTDAEGRLIPTGRERAEAEHQRAEAERQRAEAERQRADSEHERAEAERQRADRLAQQLRRLGVDPEAGAR